MNWKNRIGEIRLKNLKKGDYVWVKSKLGSVKSLHSHRDRYLSKGAIEDSDGLRLIVVRTNSDGIELVLWPKEYHSGDFFNMTDVYKVGE